MENNDIVSGGLLAAAILILLALVVDKAVVAAAAVDYALQRLLSRFLSSGSDADADWKTMGLF